MLEQMMQILNTMEEDGNVKALKVLVNAMKQESRIYFLEYKGKKVHYTVDAHNADFSNGYTVYLNTDEDDPIWCTADLITAVYAKYINTPWFNSSMETPTHDNLKPEDIKVVDNYGNVYNRKLLTYKTKAILYSKIRGENYYLKQIEKYPEVANKPIDSIYEQQELLSEMKKERLKFAGKLPIRGLGLSDCYDLRKKLIRLKAEKIKANKSYKGLQQRLDRLNKRIVKLGGK